MNKIWMMGTILLGWMSTHLELEASQFYTLPSLAAQVHLAARELRQAILTDPGLSETQKAELAPVSNELEFAVRPLESLSVVMPIPASLFQVFLEAEVFLNKLDTRWAFLSNAHAISTARALQITARLMGKMAQELEQQKGASGWTLLF